MSEQSENASSNSPQPLSAEDFAKGLESVKEELNRSIREEILRQQLEEYRRQPIQPPSSPPEPEPPKDDPVKTILQHFAGPNFNIEEEAKYVVDGKYRPANAGGHPSGGSRPPSTDYSKENMSSEEFKKFIAEKLGGNT